MVIRTLGAQLPGFQISGRPSGTRRTTTKATNDDKDEEADDDERALRGRRVESCAGTGDGGALEILGGSPWTLKIRNLRGAGTGR